MQVTIKTIEPIRVAYMRHVGPYIECGNMWQKMFQYAGPHGLMKPGVLVIGASWDDPVAVPPEQLRYDCCISVDSNFVPDPHEPPVLLQTLPGGEYASYIHIGPYGKLGETFRKLATEWFPTCGRLTTGGPCLEIYGDDHGRVPENELRTELLIPLKRT